MCYLFIHDAFPGQFVHLYRHLRRAGHEVIAASREGSTLDLPIEQLVYGIRSDVVKPGKRFDPRMEAVALGQDLFRKLKRLADEGRAPDYIVTHASRGASYFVRELFPKARITAFLEWYYRDPPVAAFEDVRALYQTCTNNAARNSVIMRDFEQADAAYAPTRFQKGQFPKRWRPEIRVRHEGVDTELYRPDPSAQLEFDGKTFDAGMEIVTYGARGMEKARGFPEFMQAVAEVQRRRPNLQVLVAAKDRLCYDRRGGKKGLKEWVDTNVDYDRERTHFVGLLPQPQFAKMLQISSLHVYLTIPFVLSWSCINALSTATPVLGADTPPVREVIEDGVNGFLVDMKDAHGVAARIEALLDAGDHQAVRQAARQTVLDRFELKACIDRQLALIEGRAG